MQEAEQKLARSPAFLQAVLGVFFAASIVLLFSVDLQFRCQDAIAQGKKTALNFAKILAEHTVLTFEGVEQTLREADARGVTADRGVTARVFGTVQQIHLPVLHDGRRVEGGVLLPPDDGVAHGGAELRRRTRRDDGVHVGGLLERAEHPGLLNGPAANAEEQGQAKADCDVHYGVARSTTIIMKDPGITGGRRRGLAAVESAGGGPNRAVTR